MAKVRLDINFHDNTIPENKSILLKLRGRCSKIDNKTSDEWIKLFAKLNSNNNNNSSNNNNDGKKRKKSAKTSTVTRQDQVVIEPIYGPIQKFPSGYWWGIRMDCSRDQIHSPFDKDIQNGAFGVASICTSHLNTTNDVDLGTLLTFTGDEYQSGKLKHPLIYNYRNEIPLRVVRSYNLANEFAPKTGYRYDGLYIVISSWIGLSSNSKKYYKFALARLNCQEPPPWSLPSKRMSQRISSFLRTGNVKAGVCGSLRCHMYGCQTQEPERKRKKIIHTNETSIAAVNVSGVCLNKSSDVQRNVNESTIVIRHVSKKCDATGIGHGMNVHSVESPVQMGHLMQQYSSKPPVCELQNTNISIRTELYDSSPNAHQDIKKTTPMTFCRIYKTNLTPVARMISSHSTNTVGTMNLNAFGPNMKDKMNQESQIQSRSGASKISDTPIVNAINCTVDNCDIKTNISTPTRNIPNENIPLEYSSNSDIELFDTKLKNETIKLVTNTEEHLDKCLDNKLPSTESLQITSRRSSNSSLSSTESLIKKLQLPEAVVTIETMTPEQMLDLIVKKRYNPTGKLLIGSIIGLPPENMLQAAEVSSKLVAHPICDSLMDNNVKLEGAITRETTNETQQLNEENYFYDSRSKSTVMPPKKIGNENIDRRMKFMRLKRARVAKALAPIEDSNIKRNKNSSKRLNKTHTTEKITQPFSKSTSIKKRRGELANLVIDANFSTKIRSHTVQTRTMSRQLRSPTIILRKRKEFKGFITNFPRVDLSRKSKGLKGMKKTRISKNRQIQKNKCEGTVKKIRRGTAKSIKPDKRMSKQVKRKNSMSQRDKISMQVSNKRIGRSKSQMVDAMTQCTLQREVSASVGTQSYSGTRNTKMVKIEWIDHGDDVKSESNDVSLEKIVYRNSQIHPSSDGTQILQTNGAKRGKRSDVSSNVCSSTNNNKCVSINNTVNSLSAFVPVNVSDGDIRVARLRSIGFKPIEPCLLHNKTLNICNSDCRTAGVSVNSTVIRRNVDEEYNKYTSEENNVVGYMDDELHYQDIEAEANAMQKKNEINSKRRCTKVQEKQIIKNNKPNQKSSRKWSRDSLEQKTNEDNVDVEEEKQPWLGWNSYVAKR